jgi:hypothetical protein
MTRAFANAQLGAIAFLVTLLWVLLMGIAPATSGMPQPAPAPGLPL